MGADDFSRQISLLIGQVGHWPPERWRGRGDAVHALAQRLADAGAAAEGHATRAVPRLADTALADQVRVLAADLLAADPPPELLESAAGDVAAVRRGLV